jgi:hypothetical protein
MTRTKIGENKNKEEVHPECPKLSSSKCGCKQRWCTKLCEEKWCERHCQCWSLKDKMTTCLPAESRKECTNCDKCKRSICHLCLFCTFHCKCERPDLLLKTPPPKRSNQDSTLRKIHETIVMLAPTPKRVPNERKEEDQLTSLGDFFGIELSQLRNLPKRSTLLASDPVAIIEKMDNSRRAEDSLAQLIEEVAKACANIILPGDPNWLLEKLHERLSRHGLEKNKRTATSERYAKDLFWVCHNMPNHTDTYKVARAIVSNTSSQKQLEACFPDLHPPKLGKDTRRRGAIDHNKIFIDFEDPKKVARSVARVDDAWIERAVKHMLSRKMVSILSWGTKPLPLTGSKEKIQFPRLTRKRPQEEMWKDFRREEKSFQAAQLGKKLTRAANKQLSHNRGRSSYLNIARHLTSQSQKKVKCVDYVTDILVNERVAVLQKIINDLVAPTQKREMTQHLVLLQNFLKNQYDDHCSLDDSVSIFF